LVVAILPRHGVDLVASEAKRQHVFRQLLHLIFLLVHLLEQRFDTIHESLGLLVVVAIPPAAQLLDHRHELVAPEVYSRLLQVAFSVVERLVVLGRVPEADISHVKLTQWATAMKRIHGRHFSYLHPIAVNPRFNHRVHEDGLHRFGIIVVFENPSPLFLQ
jgi:hypothetical protein